MNRNSSVPLVLTHFAEQLNTVVTANKLKVPADKGTGYCAGFEFNAHMRMLISDYTLNKDLTVGRPAELATGKLLFFKFQNIFPKTHKTVKGATSAPTVLAATSRINTAESFAIHSNTETINIEVKAAYLDELLGPSVRSPLLQSLLYDDSVLLFEQLIYPSLQKVVDEILTESVQQPYQLLFLKVKAEELVCRLLMELEKRNEQQLYPLNERDIRTIYCIKDNMLVNLDQPPVIARIAADAAMSPTKLKRIFKQIFGYSIFNYYQHFRMKEAARLLKEDKLPVSAVGYRLGFTNLSHFSRVFEAHIGSKPKQFSKM